MKKLSIALGLIYLLFSTASFGKEIKETQAFIDNGTFYSITENGVFKSDYMTGEISITSWAGVRQTLREANSKHLKDPAHFEIFSGLTVLNAYSGAKAACANQANAVALSAAAAASACAGGPSQSCTSAMGAFQDASDAFTECMRHFLQEN